MLKPFGNIGSYSIQIDQRAKGYLVCQELMTGYMERVGKLVPSPKMHESWLQYLQRVAKVVNKIFVDIQVWGMLDEAHHNNVKVAFNSKTDDPRQTSKLIAEVMVKSGEIKMH